MASDRPLTATETIEIDMLLLGKTGTGKSSTGNSILGREIFKASNSVTSVTTDIKSEWSKYTDNRGRHFDLKVTDGPGLKDTNLNTLQDERRAYLNMIKVLSECPEGIHAFLVVIRMGSRFTEEDKNSLEKLTKILGNDFLRKFGVLIVAGGDNLYGDEDDDESKTFEDWCREQEGELKIVMQECDNRCVLFDNMTKDKTLKKRQLDTLLELVLEIMSKNNWARYTDKTFKKYRESHEKLLKECDLTNMKEEFRKQLSMLEGEVSKLPDSTNDELNEAHELLENLLGQLVHEVTHTPRLVRLQKDLFDLKQCLTDLKMLKGQKKYDSVLNKAADLCKKMVSRASPAAIPVWLDWVSKGKDVAMIGLTIASATGGPFGLLIATIIEGVIDTALLSAKMISLKIQMKDKY